MTHLTITHFGPNSFRIRRMLFKCLYLNSLDAPLQIGLNIRIEDIIIKWIYHLPYKLANLLRNINILLILSWHQQ